MFYFTGPVIGKILLLHVQTAQWKGIPALPSESPPLIRSGEPTLCRLLGSSQLQIALNEASFKATVAGLAQDNAAVRFNETKRSAATGFSSG